MGSDQNKILIYQYEVVISNPQTRLDACFWGQKGRFKRAHCDAARHAYSLVRLLGAIWHQQHHGRNIREWFFYTHVRRRRMLRILRDAVAIILSVGSLAILCANPFVPMAWSIGFIVVCALAWALLYFFYRKKDPLVKPMQVVQSTKEIR